MADLSITTPDDATVVITAVVPRAQHEAYLAFTDVQKLAHWFWPERFEPAYELDVTPGGMWRVRSEVIDTGFTAVFGEVVADERLAMSWQWDGDEAISKVEIGFAAAGEAATTVTLTHSDNASVEVRTEHSSGWTDCLSRLIAL
jgi:uncharacterized protein YndB with AHSA1/START domain